MQCDAVLGYGQNMRYNHKPSWRAVPPDGLRCPFPPHLYRMRRTSCNVLLYYIVLLYCAALPPPQAWVRYAKFEMQNGEVARARQCYERAVEALGEDAQSVRVLN